MIPYDLQQFITLIDCPYCHETSYTNVITNNPKVVECNICGLWRPIPRINKKGQVFLLERMNDSINLTDYLLSSNEQSVKTGNKWLRKWRQKFFSSLMFEFDEFIEFKKNFLNISKDYNILDVGCSSGSFIYRLYHNYGIKAVGLEPMQKLVEYGRSRGLDVYSGRFEAGSIPSDLIGKKFDVICFRESIYYLQDLKEAFDLLHKLLKPGGGLYIKSHVPTSIYYWRYKNYLSRYGPCVASMPTIKALKGILANEGYEILKLGYFPFNILSMFLGSFSETFLGKILARVLFPIFCSIRKADRLFIFARKL